MESQLIFESYYGIWPEEDIHLRAVFATTRVKPKNKSAIGLVVGTPLASTKAFVGNHSGEAFLRLQRNMDLSCVESHSGNDLPKGLIYSKFTMGAIEV